MSQYNHHDGLTTLAEALQCRQVGADTRASSQSLPIDTGSACLPKRLTSFTVAESKNTQWNRKFDTLKECLGRGILSAFVGPCGTGKSQLAVSLAKYAMHDGKSALHVEAMELCENVKDTFSGDESAKQVLYRYTRPSLLIIDEVNRGLSQYDTRLVQRVVSRRYDSFRDTILISNETPEEFSTLVGDRVISRINDTGKVHLFTWPSFRQ